MSQTNQSGSQTSGNDQNNFKRPVRVPEDPVTTQLYLFHKNGGGQPTTLDPEAIDFFFLRNYAKIWAMQRGFIAKFKSYQDGKLQFDIISDPRFTGNEFLLSKFIAKEYKDKVNVLKGSSSYEAQHFIANDIIGFLLSGDDMKLLSEYQLRVNKAYDDLKSTPDMLHFGSLH